MNYVFTHAKLWDGKNYELTKYDANVFVKDGLIEKICFDSIIPEGYEIIDLNGKFLMPGLINLHAHLFGTGKPSKALGGGNAQKWLMRFIHTPIGHVVVRRLVKEHALNSLNSGVTTMRSSGDFVYSDVFVRDLIKNNKALGPRLIVPGPAITCIHGHGDGTFAIASDDPQVLTEYVNDHQKQNVDYIKICVTGGVMDAKVKGEPGLVKMTVEQTKAVCDRAHALGYHVASHTESSKGIKVALEGGVDTIEHGSFLDDELVQLFKDKKSAFIVTTSPALPLAKLSPEITKLNEMCVYNSEVVLDGMVEGAKRAMAEGIPVGLGTDESCPLVTSYNMWREVYQFSKLCDVSPAYAMHTATYQNAKILKMDDVTGSIEVGKSADMIVIDGDPLEDLKQLKNVDMVMVQGRLIKKPQVKRIDEIDQLLDSIM